MKPRMKKRRPHEMAKADMNLINLPISIERGVSYASAV